MLRQQKREPSKQMGSRRTIRKHRAMEMGLLPPPSLSNRERSRPKMWLPSRLLPTRTSQMRS